MLVVPMGFSTLPPVQHMPKDIGHIGCYHLAVLISDSAYAKLGSEACLHWCSPMIAWCPAIFLPLPQVSLEGCWFPPQCQSSCDHLSHTRNHSTWSHPQAYPPPAMTNGHQLPMGRERSHLCQSSSWEICIGAHGWQTHSQQGCLQPMCTPMLGWTCWCPLSHPASCLMPCSIAPTTHRWWFGHPNHLHPWFWEPTPPHPKGDPSHQHPHGKCLIAAKCAAWLACLGIAEEIPRKAWCSHRGSGPMLCLPMPPSQRNSSDQFPNATEAEFPLLPLQILAFQIAWDQQIHWWSWTCLMAPHRLLLAHPLEVAMQEVAMEELLLVVAHQLSVLICFSLEASLPHSWWHSSCLSSWLPSHSSLPSSCSPASSDFSFFSC